MNPIDNLNLNPATHMPPLVRRGWWINCIPAILGLGAYFFLPMVFEIRIPDFRFVYLAAMVPAGFLLSICAFAWGYWKLRSRVVHCKARMCTFCGYDLKMAPDVGTCSECGTRYQITETILAWNTWKEKSFNNPARRPLKDINKKLAAVVFTMCLGIWLVVVVPSRMEASRAKEASDVAHNAESKARNAWYAAMNSASGATGAERSAKADALDAAIIAELDATKRWAEATASFGRATDFGILGCLLVLASVVLWKNWLRDGLWQLLAKDTPKSSKQSLNH
jgi:hypothetical protein